MGSSPTAGTNLFNDLRRKAGPLSCRIVAQLLDFSHRGKCDRRDFWFLGADALAPVAGAVLALRLLPSPRWLAVFLALASGFFLYTATADLLPEAHRRSPSPAVTVFAVLGVLTMALAVGLTRADYGALYRFLWSSF